MDGLPRTEACRAQPERIDGAAILPASAAMAKKLLDRFNLAGKVAIVTGASRGIGEAIARGLAECGAKVVVSSRKQESVDEVAAAYKSNGLEATAVAAHMGDLQSIDRLVQQTLSAYGGVDIVVNNAATSPVYGPLLEAPNDAFQKIIDVNVRGPLELARRAYPSMVERGGGSIVSISSIGGISPESMIGLYSMSKAALISLTKAMALEWGPAGIRANAICPGLIQTKFSAALWQNEKLVERLTKELPLRRIGQPEEMAALAVFLASPASSYCTGAVFTADGGSTI
jgi:NAD(P)-dependent dehydrogenase (short-subunit alcohol dehydrogenase family)